MAENITGLPEEGDQLQEPSETTAAAADQTETDQAATEPAAAEKPKRKRVAARKKATAAEPEQASDASAEQAADASAEQAADASAEQAADASAEQAADASAEQATRGEAEQPEAEQPEAEQPATPVEQSAADTVSVDAAIVQAPTEQEPGHEPGFVSPATPASDAAAADASAPEAESDPLAAATVLPALPAGPFGLLFHAPDLEALPVLSAVEAEDDEDDDEDFDDDSQRGRRTSRRNRRSRRREPEEDKPLITEPQKVKGSTRLEAKRQRRREGRDAGRRRTVVTETEFLARRESVERQMIVRSKHDRVQLAVLEDGVLVEHYVAKASESSLIGNVYLGRVQNVLPSMEAAFVDIGRGRNAVLYSGEVDWDAAELEGQPRKIELALKPGDTVLVQVTKDPIGHKGARLTSQISLPGRYLVSVPGGSMNGISRKLPDTERARLKKILKQVLPEGVGVIVRTAAEGATEEQLTNDVERLTRQWERIQQQRKSGSAPLRLHAEPDLLVKIVRDVFNEDFGKLVIQGSEALETIREYLEAIAPDLIDRVEAYEGSDDPFSHFRISEQIDKALDRKVFLPSGGSLVIDRTEAMTVVDVNTGRFVGAGGNLEETVTKNNLEAAEEVVRQLRLRDIGGIIVIDFIDMVLESNRDLVQRRLIECLSRDRTKHQVAEVTSLGLVQMTRKKLGLGLLESYSEPCEVCAGRGVIVHHEPVSKSQRQPDNGGGGNGSGRRRGRSGKQNDQQQDQHQHQQGGGTHAITDDMRKGLSQVALAAKGKHPDGEHEQGAQDHVEQGHAEKPAAEQGHVEQPAAEQGHVEQREQSGRQSRRESNRDRSQRNQAKRDQSNGDRSNGDQSRDESSRDQSREQSNRDRSQRDGGQRGQRDEREPRSGIVQPSKQAVEAVAAEPVVTILDIPVEPTHEQPARTSNQNDLDGLLGSALDALAAPAPGTGKAARRSRRASSGVITAKPDEQ
ncbi:Rne/Rng family ribonuclease [Agrococcus sp. ARC_14]|uniref:Rne/Rng family ribonuclease n=1 Tax=Agrococcus sp. ARC_14 TaxID=2919927 RepID=UPI001F05AD80|nr:Rne/Rng family ribonuclease [Agrococcus sp. ARC_14]MCH1883399.1 Rne/Rng family ribonuclease [Agrococcus sp. ARC_14]